MQNNWRGKGIRTLALFCCLPFSGYLRADLSDYTVTSDTAQEATISQFNPALGLLNSVSLTLFVTFNGSVTYQNKSDTPGQYYIRFYQQIQQFFGPDSLNLSTSAIELFGEAEPDSSATSSYTRTGTATAFLSSSSSDLQPFIGSDTWLFDPISGPFFSVENHDRNLSDPHPTSDPVPFTLAVEYNYTPNVLPEPSFLLLTAGFFGLSITYKCVMKSRGVPTGRRA